MNITLRMGERKTYHKGYCWKQYIMTAKSQMGCRTLRRKDLLNAAGSMHIAPHRDWGGRHTACRSLHQWGPRAERKWAHSPSKTQTCLQLIIVSLPILCFYGISAWRNTWNSAFITFWVFSCVLSLLLFVLSYTNLFAFVLSYYILSVSFRCLFIF